jgi:2-dehydropantoate 2-reductase
VAIRYISTQQYAYWWPRRKTAARVQIRSVHTGPARGVRTYGGHAVERNYVPPNDIHLAGKFPVFLGGGYRRHALPLLWEDMSLPGSPGRFENEWRNTEWERKDWGKPQLGVISRPTDRKWVKRWQLHTPYTRVVETPAIPYPPRQWNVFEDLETAEEANAEEILDEDVSAGVVVEAQTPNIEAKEVEAVEAIATSEESVVFGNPSSNVSSMKQTSDTKKLVEFVNGARDITIQQIPTAVKTLSSAQTSRNVSISKESSIDGQIIVSEVVDPDIVDQLTAAQNDVQAFPARPSEVHVVQETHPAITIQEPQTEQRWSDLENEEDDHDSTLVMEMEETAPYRPDLAKETVVEPEPMINETIHILGMGTAGKYIAHSLASNPHAPPVTLLMHNNATIQQWYDEGAAIRVLRDGKAHVQSRFSVESSALPLSHMDEIMGRKRHGQVDSVIETLIVTTEPNITTSAISSIKHRLYPSSTICLVGDGLGLMDKINADLFPDRNTRPTYILGCMTHKLASTYQDFTIVEKAPGEITVSKLPRITVEKESNGPSIRRADFSWSPQSKHLISTLVRSPDMNTRTYGHKSFYKAHLQRLAIGAVIGPLSVAFDCSNDQLLFNYSISQMMHFLLGEISKIITSLPQLRNMPKIQQDFDSVKLEAIVVSAIAQTGKNISPMLQDVRAGRKTDIAFYNGYLAREAARLGIDCPRNHMLIHMVQGKQAIKSKDNNDYIPFKDGY